MPTDVEIRSKISCFDLRLEQTSDKCICYYISLRLVLNAVHSNPQQPDNLAYLRSFPGGP